MWKSGCGCNPPGMAAAFRERIDQALVRGKLDIAFDYIADLPSGARDVEIRVRVQSAGDGGCWVSCSTRSNTNHPLF